jgi:hypothetical protein
MFTHTQKCILTCTLKPRPGADYVDMYTSQRIFLENEKNRMKKPTMFTHTQKCILACTPKPRRRADHVDMYTCQSKIPENKKIIIRKPKDVHSPTRMYTPQPNWIAPFSTLAEVMVGTCCLSLSVLANVDAIPHARSQAPSQSCRHVYFPAQISKNKKFIIITEYDRIHKEQLICKLTIPFALPNTFRETPIFCYIIEARQSRLSSRRNGSAAFVALPCPVPYYSSKRIYT